MKKALITIAVIVGIGIGAAIIAAYVQNDPGTERPNEAVTAYFEEEMTIRAVADVGQPIEGFDANLLILAYPGLVAADFEGVETLEGYYEVEAGELSFVRDQEQPVTSAERMVSTEGYGTLLVNISSRKAIPVPTSEGEVDEVIGQIDTGERITAGIDQEASVFGITITPREVLEDSRCPIDADCIQAGTVRVRATAQHNDESTEEEFELNEEVEIGDRTVTLIQVTPVAEADAAINSADYSFVFEVVAE